MCGIAGCFDFSRRSSYDELFTNISSMTNALIHRGPDSGGVWVDVQTGIGLGNRRLAIIDLTDEGAQPMQSIDGRYVIVFNGEIYNFPMLRAQLEQHGYRFRGHSDTEVMLAAFVEWGIKNAIQQFNGMFAFAVWDCQAHQLWLARDRAGEKPIYYGWVDGCFYFGSELKALWAHPSFHASINREVLPLYLRHGYVPTPHSIYEGVYKLPPASLLCVDAEGYEISQYWSADEVIAQSLLEPFEGSEYEAIEALDTLLRDAIQLQMVADVPLGAFLSGGIDSSVVVALMQAQSSRPIKTFTIGFHESSYDEAKYARAVAQHLGTDHSELYVTPKQARDVIPKLPTIYDEPFADSSQIPTFLVAQQARQQVTVSLSGDGGDELFAGYTRYLKTDERWGKLRNIPFPLRKGAAFILSKSSDRLGRKAQTASSLLNLDSIDDLYLREMSHWNDPDRLVRDPGASSNHTMKVAPVQLSNFFHRMMYADLTEYLPDDILVKVDRACMAVSLESRVPLLDYRVIEFAWRIPVALKVRNRQGKWLLRQVLYRYVPPSLIERPKMGFGLPIGDWLRDPLREWADALLDSRRIENEGFFRPELIQKTWHEHVSGQRNWEYLLWDVLMFQAWLEEQRVALSLF
jgi:asparagine synthase (glutamine-hydrolysing)